MSHPDTEALAEQVVEELDPGQVIDNKVILSRRQLVAISGSGLGAGALAALGLEDASAQTGPAGQQGTSAEPNDMFAWDLNVANQVTSDLPMGGNDLTNVGALDAEDATITTSLNATGLTLSTTPSTPTEWLSLTDGVRENRFGGAIKEDIAGDNTAHTIFSATSDAYFVIVHGREEGNNTNFVDLLIWVNRGGIVTNYQSENAFSPGARSYTHNAGDLEVAIDDSGSTYNITVMAFGVRGAE